MRKIFRIPFVVCGDLLRFFVIYMPGSTGNRLRSWYYRRQLRSCGKNVLFEIGVIIEGADSISIGDNVHIDKYCILQTGRMPPMRLKRTANASFGGTDGDLIIGNHVHIVQFCVIMAYGGVRISDNCTLSAGSKIYSLTNVPNDPDEPEKIVSIMPYSDANFLVGPVVLEQNVWLGLHTIVMPGVTIGANSFSRTGSLILASFPENSVLGGSPASRVRSRFAPR